MTSAPHDEGGPPDLVDTVAPPASAPPQPQSPTPKARRARWSSFEGEILRTIVLPKLRSTYVSARPTSVQEFLDAYRAAHEPDVSLVDFQAYLEGLGVKTVRITVFEGLMPPEPAPQPLQARSIPFEAFEFERTPRAPQPGRADDDDGSFDNENPDEFIPPENLDPFMSPEVGDSLLRSLGPDPEALNP